MPNKRAVSSSGNDSLKKVYLSVDPGFVKLGLAIMDEDKKLIDYALVKEYNVHHAKEANERINQQMIYLTELFAAYLDDNKVTNVSWELVPGRAMSSQTMVNSALSVLKVLTFQRKLDYHAYAAVAWHNLLFRQPRIEKIDVKEWVLEQYPEVNPKLTFDVFDAIAICNLSVSEESWHTI